MPKRRWWLIAGTLLILIAAGVVATASGFAARAWRYADRTAGLTATGRANRFDLRWAQAKAQYAERLPQDYSYGTLYRIDYPAKAELLTDLDRVRHALQEAFQTGRPEPFHVDLLLSLDAEFAREVVRSYLEQGDCGYSTAVQQALSTLFPADQLKRIILALDGPCKEFAFHTLPPEAANPAFLDELIAQYPDTGAPSYILGHPAGFKAAVALYPRQPRAGKLSTIRAHSLHQLTPPPEWLTSETDRAVRQELLYVAKDEAGLLAAIEQDGAFAENSFWRSNVRWQRDVLRDHPESFLARGVRAYEQVRGRAYFHLDRLAQRQPIWEYGNQYYDCDREIPGWEAYLREWSRHPGTGDAAYRLGRCYEITGQYALALQRFYTGLSLPDGSMRYHSQGRIVWLLDALLSESDLEALNTADELPAELKRAVAYSLALRQMRTGHYDQAVVQFDALLSDVPTGEAPLLTGRPIWSAVKQQRAKAARLAELQATGTPEALYDLAAAIYHDERIFENQLWEGGRIAYFTYGGHASTALSGDMDPAYTRWFAQSNNYVQAAEAFAKLEGAPEAIAVKAIYSRGLALTRLAEWPYADVVLWQPGSEYARQAEQAMRTVAERYPRHELAPDALLTLGYLTGQQSYFDQILRRYPKSTAAVTARTAKPSPRDTTTWVPFRYLALEEAPPAIADRLRERVASHANATIDHEGQTYVLVTAKEDRQTGRIGFYDTGEGRMEANVIWKDDPEGLGYVLVRTNLITDFLVIHQTHDIR
ncbi:MAG TPA: hypothetical protein VK464_11740 [Symbiobacteriaceae bacterium]|nr:hypothetical protein [Symbiobacteriaceae bacterium]